MSDGTYQSVLYSENIHYKDLNGNYVPIDNSIIDDEKVVGNIKHHYSNKANSYTVRFSKTDSDFPVYIEYDGTSISFGLDGAKTNNLHKNVIPKIKSLTGLMDVKDAVM